LQGILEAAEEETSPVLMQINPIHFHLTNLPNYLDYVKAVIAKVKVPVGINLDHGNSEAIILKGIHAGFPSVMFDGSKMLYQKNLLKRKRLYKCVRLMGLK